MTTVKRRVGMRKSIKIKVTQQHINEGCKGNLHLCPIAKAVRAAGFKGTISVTQDKISIGRYGPGQKEYILPKEASSFVRTFDDDRKVKPFTFTAKEYVW